MRESIRTFNWGTLALGLAFVVALLCTRNYHRFVNVPTCDTCPIVVIDTRTGQGCNPYPGDTGPSVFPKCSDLARSWR